MLIKSGANVDAKNIMDDTPLHAALSRGRDDTAEFLIIVAGANVNAQNKLGATPLEKAIVVGSEKAGKLLLENGANPTVNFSEDPTKTLLEIAVELKCDELVEHLKEYIARWMRRNKGSADDERWAKLSTAERLKYV